MRIETMEEALDMIDFLIDEIKRRDETIQILLKIVTEKKE